MPNSMPMIIGRCLLGLYFLIPGLAKFVFPGIHVALMENHGMVFALPLLMISGLAAVGGGVLLIAGRFVRATAFGFVLYIVLVNLFLHDFWNLDGITAQHELQNFLKNTGIAAGLLVLAGASPKRSFRNWNALRPDTSGR